MNNEFLKLNPDSMSVQQRHIMYKIMNDEFGDEVHSGMFVNEIKPNSYAFDSFIQFAKNNSLYYFCINVDCYDECEINEQNELKLLNQFDSNYHINIAQIYTSIFPKIYLQNILTTKANINIYDCILLLDGIDLTKINKIHENIELFIHKNDAEEYFCNDGNETQLLKNCKKIIKVIIIDF